MNHSDKKNSMYVENQAFRQYKFAFVWNQYKWCFMRAEVSGCHRHLLVQADNLNKMAAPEPLHTPNSV